MFPIFMELQLVSTHYQTDADPGKVWVNLSQVTSIQIDTKFHQNEIGDGKTPVTGTEVNTTDSTFFVKETPSEIASMADYVIRSIATDVMDRYLSRR